MHFKTAVIKGVALPQLLFDAEIHGMTDITRKMQTFLNQICRVSTGMGPKTRVSSVAPWRQMRTPLVYATAAARRARAVKKCDDRRTWIKVIKGVSFRTHSWTWVTGAGKGLNRAVSDCLKKGG